MKTHGWTEEQLMSLPDIGHKYELVDGWLDASQGGMEHSRLAVQVSSLLLLHVEQNRLGVVLSSETGFWMANGNLRSPDVSFVSAKRLEQLTRRSKGFLHGSPDLAVEILSPFDSARRIKEKIAEYFENETVLVWVVNPADKTVAVHHSASEATSLRIGDSLSGEQVVRGFSFPVAGTVRGAAIRLIAEEPLTK